MKLENNPLLKQENYAAQYNESIQKLKDRPELIEFDKICYELFQGNEMGRKFIEIVKERYLLPPSADRHAPNFKEMVIWGEGFKDFPRMLIACVKSHDIRIKAEGSQ